ncbi:MAG: hypothetical protein WC393_04225 [Candidatus Nanoarchaeia archaeon]|jgi:hypothetical protein
MNYIINQYFHEKICENASEKFTQGVEFFLSELSFGLERKIMPYARIENLVCYNPYKRSIDCEQTRNSFRNYFSYSSANKGAVNIFYLDKLMIFENEDMRVRTVAFVDKVLVKNNLPFLSNVFVNANYQDDENIFLVLGMHEASHLFDLWHCSTEEVCILRDNRINYGNCLRYYNKNNEMPFCKEHLSKFMKLKC